MKYFLVLITLLTLHAFGDETKKEESFDEVKSKIVGMLDMRISKIQEEKSCVAAAKSKDDLKKCREKMRAESHKSRTDFKSKMKEKKSKK